MISLSVATTSTILLSSLACNGFIIPPIQKKALKSLSLDPVDPIKPVVLTMTTESFPISVLTPVSSATRWASLGLMTCTAIGMVADKSGGGYGIIISMVIASILSNCHMIPSDNILYDLCWTTVLPTSLALLLFSSASASSSASSSSSASASSSSSLKTYDRIRSLTRPFLLASLGSIVGCIISFVLPIIRPHEAASLAAGCLCASYVGGSINFWSTARALGETGASSSSSSLLAAMAASDLIVMAAYFGGMTLLAKRVLGPTATSWLSKDENEQNHDNDSIKIKTHEKIAIIRRVSSTITILSLSHSLSHLSQQIENKLVPIPGIACGLISLLAPLTSRHILPRLLRTRSTYVYATSTVSPFLSTLYFHLLFASIGATAHVATASFVSDCLAALCFATVALSVHVGLLLLSLFRHFHVHDDDARIQIKEVMMASNAAIGGPATAAMFTGGVLKEDEGYVAAATFWGVLGYATGTVLGVGLTTLLRTFFC